MPSERCTDWFVFSFWQMCKNWTDCFKISSHYPAPRTDSIFGLNHLNSSLSCFSGHQLCAAPASPSSCHPHGPARGPSPTAAAGVPALSTRSAAPRGHWDWSGWWRWRWWRGRPFGVRPAATAGASDTEAEAADPAADTHRRVPATARAAVSATRGPAAGAH